MDTSKKYIKMCEKAEEIQNFRIYAVRGIIFKFEDGDVISHSKTSIETYKESTPDHDCDYTIDDEHIWLPRQDQLQGMVEGIIKLKLEAYVFHWSGLKRWELVHRKTNDYIFGASMEQLWLAFVMKEKYNKKWDGEEWIEGIK